MEWKTLILILLLSAATLYAVDKCVQQTTECRELLTECMEYSEKCYKQLDKTNSELKKKEAKIIEPFAWGFGSGVLLVLLILLI